MLSFYVNFAVRRIFIFMDLSLIKSFSVNLRTVISPLCTKTPAYPASRYPVYSVLCLFDLRTVKTFPRNRKMDGTIVAKVKAYCNKRENMHHSGNRKFTLKPKGFRLYFAFWKFFRAFNATCCVCILFIAFLEFSTQ